MGAYYQDGKWILLEKAISAISIANVCLATLGGFSSCVDFLPGSFLFLSGISVGFLDD